MRGRSSIESFVDRVVEGSGLLTHLHFDGERLVHGVSEVCYQELPPAEARAYRFLGLHPARSSASRRWPRCSAPRSSTRKRCWRNCAGRSPRRER
ncbi:hypothetical protein [Saccharopolyspora gregorii]|uniref:hypothetical protein n=1 Tax=Saccharopolyspora gregorii TaxID=33914 RepID=UPI0031EE5C86